MATVAEAEMVVVNMHEAKTHLSKLVEKAVNGEPFVIARAGKPLVKVVALEAEQKPTKSRIGFMKGMFDVPLSREEFKAIGREEIEEMFGLND
jgi:prevent-host-death family protein